MPLPDGPVRPNIELQGTLIFTFLRISLFPYEKDKFYRATADAARRAVFDSSPLPLPKGKESKFKNFTMDFNPSFINNY